MKFNHFLILIKLSELESLFPKRLIIIPSVLLPQKTQKKRWQHRSGYAMICRFVLDKKRPHNGTLWHLDNVDTLTLVNNSIVGNKNTPYFGASDRYFSFGANALYKIDDTKSSVVSYANKRGTDDTQTRKFTENHC